MVSFDRQQVIETNRSLRTIKTELEALLEKGVLTESAFDSIHALLPAEGALSAVPRRGASPLPTPATTPSTTAAPTPPSYAQSQQSTGNSTANSAGAAPPPLPGRRQPPPAPPAKPIIAHCRALYSYNAQDQRDCSFEKGDRLAVYEKMNADWWLGVNERTKEEGIFPKAYVEEEGAQPAPAPAPQHGGWGSEKAGGYGGYQPPAPGGYGAAGGYPGAQYGGAQQQYGAYPPPPGQGQVSAYNSSAPPMAMANGEEQKPSKVEENGKKIGKKLGNAAIFGAGATLGSNLVNSIF